MRPARQNLTENRERKFNSVIEKNNLSVMKDTVLNMDVNRMSTLDMVNVENMSVVDIIDFSKNGRIKNDASVFSTLLLPQTEEEQHFLLPDVDKPKRSSIEQETTLNKLEKSNSRSKPSKSKTSLST